MSKHPGPWTITKSGFVQDATEDGVAQIYTDDPETRAVLLHAAEMWDTLKKLRACKAGVTVAVGVCDSLVDEIESEIAAGKGKP